MTNGDLLRMKINSRGLKLGYVCEQLHLTLTGLANKLQNRTEFKQSEILILTDLLGLTSDEREQIFFAPPVEINATEEAVYGK